MMGLAMKKESAQLRGSQKVKGNEARLPKNWAWASLGDVTLPVKKVTPSLRPNHEIKYLDISSIDNHDNRIIDAKSLRGKDAPSRARQLVKEDDILFSTVRTYLKNIAKVPAKFNNQVASTGFSVIRPAKASSPTTYFFIRLAKNS